MSYNNLPIRHGQCHALVSLIGKVTTDRQARLWITSQLVGREVETSKHLTIGDWYQIRDSAYPNWMNGEWEPTSEFTQYIQELYDEYQKEIGDRC